MRFQRIVRATFLPTEVGNAAKAEVVQRGKQPFKLSRSGTG